MDLKSERAEKLLMIEQLREEQFSQFRFSPELHIRDSPRTGAATRLERQAIAKRADELQPIVDRAADAWIKPKFGSVPRYIARVGDTMRDAGWRIQGTAKLSGQERT
jgi:hypothetical protein